MYSTDIVKVLYERLPEHWRTVQDGNSKRKRVILRLATYLDPETQVLTGLSSKVPPNPIPMLGGKHYSIGSLQAAQLVINELARAQLSFESGNSYLDFGCSSGPVVRLLSTVFSDSEWIGVDPQPDALNWAKQNLHGVDFQHSSQEPPLPLGTRTIDGSFALSIWSHFHPDAAIDWFEEMARITKPGGWLMFSTHGEEATKLQLERKKIKPRFAEKVDREMSANGCSFFNPWASAKNPYGLGAGRWGMAYFKQHWMADNLPIEWKIHRFTATRYNGVQDIYMLVRT